MTLHGERGKLFLGYLSRYHCPSLDNEMNKAVLALLHGRGGVASDLASLASSIPAPWSPLCLQAPLPLGDGFEWFRVRDAGSPRPTGDDISPAAGLLLEQLESLAPGSQVGILGYSQGGAVALQALRRASDRIAFVVTVAGFTTIDADPGDSRLAQQRPPVLWARGDRDDVIPNGDILRMQEFLPRHVALDERVYRGAGHEITPAMAADVVAFISAQPVPER